MATTVTIKRSTRITFLGSSNLPQQKALAMRDSLQAIVLYLTDLHAACDDTRIKVDEKHKMVKDLVVLSKEINQLTALGKDQVDLCEGEPDIHRQVNEVYSRIKSHAEGANKIFANIGNNVKGVEQEAAQAVDHVLAIVRETVELLKVADKFTIRRVDQLASTVSTIVSNLQLAQNESELAEDEALLTKASGNLARVVSQRAGTIDNEGIRRSLEDAATSLSQNTPSLITAAHNALGRGGSQNQVTTYATAINTAAQNISKVLSTAPEFAVMFDVDYLDTELAVKLAALAASVRAADPINVSKHSKAVSAEVAKQVKSASNDKAPATQEKILKAQNATTRVLDVAKEALTVRSASKGPADPPYIAAENQLAVASSVLQEAVAGLPVGAHHSTHLIKAAQDLSAKMRLLLS